MNTKVSRLLLLLSPSGLLTINGQLSLIDLTIESVVKAADV